uniref:Uncharacterized protein n=1 Tax=Rhizophora mucronata TaxID=61149 RepID=A0A2P2KU06_RHIMU
MLLRRWNAQDHQELRLKAVKSLGRIALRLRNAPRSPRTE